LGREAPRRPSSLRTMTILSHNPPVIGSPLAQTTLGERGRRGVLVKGRIATRTEIHLIRHRVTVRITTTPPEDNPPGLINSPVRRIRIRRSVGSAVRRNTHTRKNQHKKRQPHAQRAGRSLVPEIQRTKIGSHTYYYLSNRFSPDQVQSKIRQIQKKLNHENSRRADKGRCFEAFARATLQLMVDRNHLRLPQERFTWDYSYKDGKPNYSVRIQCLGGPKYHEFDRVLRAPIEPISTERFRQEVVFVLECKYRSKRTFTYKDIERFAQKLANTYQFGYTARSRSPQGQWFYHRAIRHNVVPILVTGSKGQDFDYYDEFTHIGRTMNPVSYAASMGMIVIFAGDFEKYLAEQTGKPAKLSKLYDRYAKQDEGTSFEEFLQQELGL